jgi:hypothetical protein
MYSIVTTVLASAVTVPDLHPTGIALGIGVLSLGVVARILKAKKK